jgi:O-antigen ligase
VIARVTLSAQGFLWRHPAIRANLVRVLGAVALLVAEMMVGLFIGRGSQMLAFVLVGLPAAYLVVVYQRFGVLLILAAALFVRFKIPTGTASDVVISMAFTGLFVTLWLLPKFVIQRRISLLPTAANKPLLLFMATTAIALIWSNFFRDPLVRPWGSFPIVQATSTVVILLLGSAFLLIANTIEDPRILKGMVVLFLLASVPGYLGLEFVQTRGVFTMWVIALAYSQALFNRRLPWWLRLACLGLTALWVEWSLLRRLTWLSSWVPAMVVLALLTFLRSRKLFLILMIVAVAFLFTQRYVIESAFAAEQDESGHTRIDAWAVNWRVTGKHLLFGTGPAGYAAYYMSYWPNEGMATHNNYVDILAEMGVVGLFFYLWFFGAVLWSAYRLFRRLRDRWDFDTAYTAAVFIGGIGVMIVMGLGDWVIPFAYTQGIEGYDYALYSWLFMGGLYVVERLAQPEPAPDTSLDTENRREGTEIRRESTKTLRVPL